MQSLGKDFLLIFVYLQACNIPRGTTSLKMSPLVVPSVAAGQMTALTCPFLLEDDVLYSVKWYKDHEEFYSFVPKNDPTQHRYHLEGLLVDMDLSNEYQVILKEVTCKTSGTYRCEVTAEAPLFPSVLGEAYLQVISMPEEPKIRGGRHLYSVGDAMSLNCSFLSCPPATLRWYINDQMVASESDEDVALCEMSELSQITSSVGLVLEPHHLLNNQMVVRCEAKVGPEEDPKQSTARIAPQLVHHKETSLLLQARGSSASCPSWNFAILLPVFIFI